MSITNKKENEKRELHAEKGLYYCADCKDFLPRISFNKANSRKFGVPSYCKCHERIRTQSSPSYKKIYKKGKLSKIGIERDQQKKKGLYYCEICKKFLPGQFFTPVKDGMFGKRNVCKICYNKSRNTNTLRIKVEVPKNLHYDVKYLMIYNNQSIEEVLTNLIYIGLESTDTS